MKNTDIESKPGILRQKAEALLKKKTSRIASDMSEAEIEKLNYEFEVYQIELELQNKELRHAWAVAEVAVDKYTKLFDFAPSGYITLSKEGKILEINYRGASMLGKERSLLQGAQLGFFISQSSRPAYNLFIEKVFTGDGKETCELVLTTNEGLLMIVHFIGVVTESGKECLVNMIDVSSSR